MKNVLILTAGFGEGHNTAARNLRDALNATGEARAETSDIFALAYGRFNELARKAYLLTINHAPKLWARIYQLFDAKGSVEANMLTLGRMRRKLLDELKRTQPAVVVSTYPLYSFLLAKIFASGSHPRVPLVTIVTDSITINSVWYRSPSDLWIVPNQDTARVMEKAGLPADLIRADGFPVSRRFDVPPVRATPGDAGGRKVLFMINFARAQAPALVEKMLEVPGLDLTVTVGRDEELHGIIERIGAAAGRSIEIHGWTDKLPDLMLSHHVLLSKAGGATVQEAIAACIPMLVSQVVPGQEEGNVQLLLDHNCGAFTPSPGEICDKLREAFAEDAALWRTWSKNLEVLSRPGASGQIARYLLDEMAG